MNGHRYTKEQDEFIRNNYTHPLSECVTLFNQRFGTDISYAAIKSHAIKKLRLKSDFRKWNPVFEKRINELLIGNSYKTATEQFNTEFGTSFSQKKIEIYCTRNGIYRGISDFLKTVDDVIIQNYQDKTYSEIKDIIYQETGKSYGSYTAVCVRANNMGLHRPHRVWGKDDNRTLLGEQVTFSEFVRFIGNRWHRLPTEELKKVALQVARLQAAAKAYVEVCDEPSRKAQTRTRKEQNYRTACRVLQISN